MRAAPRSPRVTSSRSASPAGTRSTTWPRRVTQTSGHPKPNIIMAAGGATTPVDEGRGDDAESQRAQPLPAGSAEVAAVQPASVAPRGELGLERAADAHQLEPIAQPREPHVLAELSQRRGRKRRSHCSTASQRSSSGVRFHRSHPVHTTQSRPFTSSNARRRPTGNAPTTSLWPSGA
jgi:hypothetical protein